MAKKKAESTEEKAIPAMPERYVDGNIDMLSSMITTEEAFIKLFKATKQARGLDLAKAFEKAEKWKAKFN